MANNFLLISAASWYYFSFFRSLPFNQNAAEIDKLLFILVLT